MKPLSSRLANIHGAGGRELIDRSKPFYYFGTGTIDFDTFDHIHAEAIKAIQEDFVGYTDNRGWLPLREAIADKLARENGCHYSADEILVTPGSSEALAAIPNAVLEPGDEAIMFDPHYIGAFRAIVELACGVPVVLPTDGANNWQPDPDMVERAVTPRTKLLFLCSPSNPVGAALTRESVEAMCDIARRHDLYVVSDELYEKIMFDGKQVVSPASLPDMRERTFTCNGFSKAYGMTGWRVGYVAAPLPLLQAVHKAQVYVGICAPSISQRAAWAALTGPQGQHAQMLQELDRRRQTVVGALNTLPGISCQPQDGTFYSFADARDLMQAKGEAVRAVLRQEAPASYVLPESISAQFSDFLMLRGNVYVSGGGAFGACGEGYFRVSEADRLENIQRGLGLIEQAVRSI
jgi:aspartate/methionine/tyrosine aminotransferase